MGCQRFNTLTNDFYVANWWLFQVPQAQLMDLQEQDHGVVLCSDCAIPEERDEVRNSLGLRVGRRARKSPRQQVFFFVRC